MNRVFPTFCLIALALLRAPPLGGQEPEGADTWSDPSPHEVRRAAVAPDVELEVLV